MTGTVVLLAIDYAWGRLLELGCDEAALLRRVSRPRGAPWARVPIEALYDVVEAGMEALGDPDLGHRLARRYQPGEGGILFTLMFACPNVRAAVRLYARYQHLMSDAYRVDVEDHDRRLVVTVPGEDRPARAQLAVWICSGMLHGIHSATGVWRRPVEVTFTHAAPSDRSVLERFFGCPITYSAPRDTMLLDERTMSWPAIDRGEVVLSALEHHVREAASALPRRTTWRDRVRSALEAELPAEPTVDAAAARLRISTRTLQRRLRSEGTSIAEVVTSLRRELAARYLREGREVAEVAHLLGYAAPASFHRAFRAWYGMTPGELRARDASSTE